MTPEQTKLCETIKRMGYAKNTQVKLDGKIFDLVSDPVCIGNLILVRVQEFESDRVTWARIPLSVVERAQGNHAMPNRR